MLTTGLAASPGAASGKVVFTADEAEARASRGEAVILVRSETAPDDLHGMIAAHGILTARGGLVSHAAVVARGMGKPAVCGASELEIDQDARTFTVDGTTVHEDDVVSINGATGEVVLGEVAVVIPKPGKPFEALLNWADRYRRLRVRANADTPADAIRARSLGAEGIGLCRTEHMFLGERLPLVQRMILADNPEEEQAALHALEEVQRRDFVELFDAMGGLPVTVRLLDAPLHEFLPDVEELVVTQTRGELDPDGMRLLRTARLWQEDNPMLGTRGCRLAIVKPGLYRMQTRALLQAAVECERRGTTVRLEIMIPLVAIAEELTLLASWVREEADAVLAAVGEQLAYRIGTMIETPRAALQAGTIAWTASFFSFGTNDLTQMTFGLSRDDAEARIMPRYLSQQVLRTNPFKTIDQEGVGRLLSIAVVEGRKTRPDLELGVCGEHGGDPASIAFCHNLGLDYVSCSPYRVPVARLAAAHAALGVTAESTGS